MLAGLSVGLCHRGDAVLQQSSPCLIYELHIATSPSQTCQRHVRFMLVQQVNVLICACEMVCFLLATVTVMFADGRFLCSMFN